MCCSFDAPIIVTRCGKGTGKKQTVEAESEKEFVFVNKRQGRDLASYSLCDSEAKLWSLISGPLSFVPNGFCSDHESASDDLVKREQGTFQVTLSRSLTEL